MERWHNKVAVVTGASAGIGAACVKDLLERGMLVVGLARRLERMEELRSSLPEKQQVRFHPLICDVCKEEDILRSFAWVEKQLGSTDVLINNAGVIRQTRLLDDNNTADMRTSLDTNLLAVALCTREAFRSMKQRDFAGHVVIINSVLGHKVPNLAAFPTSIYVPIKHAITAMTEVLRQEFLINKTKIKITSISPGIVDTEIFGEKSTLPPEFPFLRAEDISDAVVYCIQTPPNVQIHELTLQPIGQLF